MLKLSQSFCMGKGSLEHNLRITKGAGVRQNGVKERRFLNEDITAGNKFEKNYVHNLIHNAVAEKIGDKLAMLNEKHIAMKEKRRVCTIDDWLKKQAYTRGDKQKKIVSEYIVSMGNRFTACPYEMQLDAKGNMLDDNGNVIPEWDTRRRPAYKDGKIIESKICKKLKKVYKDFIVAFEKANPQAQVISASIHADEGGHVHMHLSVLWWSKTKNGVGYGLAETTAIRQQYEAKGIYCNRTRFDNAQNEWRKEMRQLLKDVALEHGIERLDMGNKEKHRSIYEFQQFKDKYCEKKEKEFDTKEKAINVKQNILNERRKNLFDKENDLHKKELELNEKETELSKDIAKQEWYILKKKYPDIYNLIHSEYMMKKNVNKGIDKTNICSYNRGR